MDHRFVAIAALLASALAPRGVAAHAGSSRSSHLVIQPDGSTLALRTVYGMALSQDAGTSFRWICQQAALYSESDDPEFAITREGTLLVGFWMGLSQSRDQGCSFSFVGSGLAQRFVVDVVARPNDDNGALALVSEGVGGGVFLTQVWETPDNGASWATLGPDLPDDLDGYTLAASRSRPARLYVSAMDDVSADPTLLARVAVILRSDDGGAGWERFSVSGTDSTMRPYLLGVDPLNPERVFLRIDAPEGDALMVSENGGETFREVLRKQGKLYGFAISPDGGSVLAGYGDPKDPAVTVDPLALGVWSAPASTLAFDKLFDGPIGCLEWTNAGIYACTAEDVHGFDLGISTDGGSHFCGLLTIGAMEGALECASGCAERWAQFCSVTSCDTATAPAGDCFAGGNTGGVGGTGVSGASGSSGSGGSGGSGVGGAGALAGAGGVGVSGSGGSASSTGESGACACRSSGTENRGRLPSAALLAIAGVSRLRRRKSGTDRTNAN